MLCKIGKLWVESGIVNLICRRELREGPGCEIWLDGYDHTFATTCTPEEIDSFASGVNAAESDDNPADDEGCCGECHPRCDELG